MEFWDVELAQMPTAQLFAAAQIEVPEEHPEDHVPHLVALHQRPTREVFDVAACLLVGGDPATRELGARVLRELGPHDDAGRRPFSAEAVPLLVDRLAQESEPRVLGWVISALGYNGAREALGEVLRLTEHPHWRVRFHVAAALPSLVDPDHIESRALNALQHLCGDDEADIRFYALYALLEEVTGVDRGRNTQLIIDLMNDPDEQIRRLAREHHDACH
ncbi:HEAT repeat domain-containing protein [Catellatospora sp. NPDC049609]|uniref:HEAT repeat domain-containing protein n=1 Tax=Catellatospora sp. NPDC049609 TaxID=3155505 RepID=UPI00342FC203